MFEDSKSMSNLIYFRNWSWFDSLRPDVLYHWSDVVP
jgi:hypothetical protein